MSKDILAGLEEGVCGCMYIALEGIECPEVWCREDDRSAVSKVVLEEGLVFGGFSKGGLALRYIRCVPLLYYGAKIVVRYCSVGMFPYYGLCGCR